MLTGPNHLYVGVGTPRPVCEHTHSGGIQLRLTLTGIGLSS